MDCLLLGDRLGELTDDDLVSMGQQCMVTAEVDVTADPLVADLVR